MRITGGKARGIPLKVSARARLRPATDRTREAVFASLGDIAGLRFIDLFAGSGAYGLEAWSRGAAGGIFVEKNRRLSAALTANARAVAKSLNRNTDAVEIVCADALRWQPHAHSARKRRPFGPPPDPAGASAARSPGEEREHAHNVSIQTKRFQTDLIFIDPPYDSIREIAPFLFDRACSWLAPAGRLIFEMPGDFIPQPPPALNLLRRIGRGRHNPTCAIYTR